MNVFEILYPNLLVATKDVFPKTILDGQIVQNNK